MGEQIAGALAAAHDAGIVHRDVKPGNVLLTKDGTAKLTDFGISHAVGDGTITASGVLAGTPAFLAPEVAKGQDPDFHSDVFSFGATLYTALEGQPPFGINDNPIGMLHQIATRDSVIPPVNAGALTPALNWMLHMEPGDRPTMKQAQEALAAVVAGEVEQPPAPTVVAPVPPPVIPPATAAAPPPPERSRRRALAALGIVALLAVAGIVAVLLTRGNGPRANAAADTSHQTTTHQAPPATTTKSVTATTTSSPAVRTTTTNPPTTSGNPAAGPQVDPVTFITDYYKLVPGNLQAAWPQMTMDYQQHHANGWSGYTQYWSQFSSVSLSGVSLPSPATVVATLHYVYKSGATETDQMTFKLVPQGNSWQISWST